LPVVGELMQQQVAGGYAYGYVASFDTETSILKYFKDRSIVYNTSTADQTDYVGISTFSKNLEFSSTNIISGANGFTATIDTTFNASSLTVNNKVINLDSSFISGASSPEINKTSGDIIFIDNRPLVTRSSRQKEDIKIILEF